MGRHRSVIIGLALAAAASAQSFDVASIRVNTKAAALGEMSSSGVRIAAPGHVQVFNANLRECLEWAYQVNVERISGPEWLEDNRPSFYIDAKAAPETPGPELRRMLQRLLAERFAVKLRQETKTVAGYYLVVAKGAPKPPPVKADASPGMVSSVGGLFTGGSVTAERLARALANELKRPVVDKTGIDQRFSFDLRYSPDGDGERPSLFTALEQTLGLKLTAAKLPVEHLVVESARRLPTEN